MRGFKTLNFGQRDGVAVAAFVLLAFCMLFGGASRQHEFRLALVELSALPLLVLSLPLVLQSEFRRTHQSAILLLAGVVSLPLLQLIPLPPAIWTEIPGRGDLALALEITNLQPGWIPLTLTPDKTWNSVLALVPPVAMFFGILALGPEARTNVVKLALALTLAAILAGTVQLASGSDPFYLWATTAAGNVVGFFANRNHMATLCLMMIPFASVIGAGALRRNRGKGGSTFWLMALFVALAVIALGVIRSRTGVILAGPVLGASLLAAWIASRGGGPKPVVLALAGAAVAAVMAIAIVGLAPLLARFDTQGGREARYENWPVIAEAANTYLPLGSGMGSFDAVFRSVEPLERLDATYFNQAHNDYLETWLEAGWLGASLIVGFLLWFAARTMTAWRASPSTLSDLQRAASISIGVVALHSAVDYPVRTATIATLLALSCALLELSQGPNGEPGKRHRTRRRVVD